MKTLDKIFEPIPPASSHAFSRFRFVKPGEHQHLSLTHSPARVGPHGFFFIDAEQLNTFDVNLLEPHFIRSLLNQLILFFSRFYFLL